MAPRTIFDLKRAPSCSRLRSAQRRKVLRTRTSAKTMSSAVMKDETAYNVRTSRQVRGWNGASSEPSVKTAASSRVRMMPPTMRRSR